MRVLGAILAGGRSTRFGSDKAEARIDGRCLLDHAADALRPQSDELVLCGRTWTGLMALPDRPAPDLGPLGGLNAALHHAHARGFDAVLCAPVDVYPLPGDLRAGLAGYGPRVLGRQWSIGFWPASLAAALDRHLEAGYRSLRSWIGVSAAETVEDCRFAMTNLNRPEDLERLSRRQQILVGPGTEPFSSASVPVQREQRGRVVDP
ncbi:molybdenum cofactor guanylyltransferase [Sphingosinicella sp. BN140058]|uniref:molybdenum cofactor guanylyltransferase n=1 Tax=Sphingosinicella sp. BN140058 TaxID=1892855 RepID=UPI0010104361|nr:molybdenum cofactor guanylyltransferase [Sphingosinicella sp. BN140058]QAY77511.1 molybdenum cofactor guanylyltransferase [Sphingosinicella sp. BN140058]